MKYSSTATTLVIMVGFTMLALFVVLAILQRNQIEYLQNDLAEVRQPMERECLRGMFTEELQPETGQYFQAVGYICGVDLNYVFGVPQWRILNEGVNYD